MNKKEITKRYFDRIGHVKNYVDNYKPKTRSQISQNLHIDNRLVYHLETSNIIKFDKGVGYIVWNEKIPVTHLLAETVGSKVTKANTEARKNRKSKTKIKVKVSWYRRVINFLLS